MVLKHRVTLRMTKPGGIRDPVLKSGEKMGVLIGKQGRR